MRACAGRLQCALGTSRLLRPQHAAAVTTTTKMEGMHNPALNRPMIAKGDPFGRPGQAGGYSAFRPNYPAELMDAVVATLKAKGCLDGTGKDGSTVVDICTGTGQVLRKLAHHFQHAKGFDRSVAQLSQATQGNNIVYAEADACAIPVAPKSIPVVTCAQAMHWLEIPKFLRGVDMILKPGGVFVLMGYPRSHIPKVPAADAAMMEWYQSLDDVWDCDRALLDREFEGTDYAPFVQVGKHRVEETHLMTPERLGDYLDTWSSFRTWKENHPDVSPDTLGVLKEKLHAVLRKEGVETLPVEFVFFAVFLQRPGEV